MYNYYYTDVNNHVIGYDNIEDIKYLIKIGIITPQTKIYNRHGKEISKNQIFTTPPKKSVQNSPTDNISETKNSIHIDKFLKELYTYEKSSYRQINTMIAILEILSNIFLYLGSIISSVAFIIILHYNNTVLAFLVFISGFIASIILWFLSGFGADLLKLKLNIASDLNEIKKAALFKDE
jgi:hypothetical protein